MIKNVKKILPGLLALILLVSFVAVFFQAHAEVIGVYQVMRDTIAYPAAAAININRHLSGEEKNVPGKTEDKTGNFYNLLFLIGNLAALNNLAQVVMIMGMVFAAGYCILKTDPKSEKEALAGRLRHYIVWSLKFLTPIQKSIINRADVYDINPISAFLWGRNPCFVLQSAGFFYGYEIS